MIFHQQIKAGKMQERANKTSQSNEPLDTGLERVSGPSVVKEKIAEADLIDSMTELKAVLQIRQIAGLDIDRHIEKIEEELEPALQRIRSGDLEAIGNAVATLNDGADPVCHDVITALKIGAEDVMKMGKWTEYIELSRGENRAAKLNNLIKEKLLNRVPQDPIPLGHDGNPLNGPNEFPGFDAGVAVALGLIPKESATLAATLHSRYDPALVKQVTDSIEGGISNPSGLKRNSEAAWWLAGCATCKEGSIDRIGFVRQIYKFLTFLSPDKKELNESGHQAAVNMLGTMLNSASTDSRFGTDVSYGTKDGCLQGGYLKGKFIGVQEIDDAVFIGTCHQGGFKELFSGSVPAHTAKVNAPGFYFFISDDKDKSIAEVQKFLKQLREHTGRPLDSL